MKTHYILFAKRMGGTVTQLCKDYDQWLAESQKMLEDGFMVSLDDHDEMWSLLDAKGQVVFVRDVDLVRGANSWLS